MRKFKSNLISTVSTCALVAVGVLGAQAQETELEGIVIVGGETVERNIQETPTSVAVITGEELDQSIQPNVYDVIEQTPNVSSSFGEKGFSIRGIDQRGPGAAGTGLLVNVIVDGVSLPTNQSTFFGPYSTWDLEQIEVLRGPQSTQQGRNALAGAIVIRSADPFHGREAKVRQDFETFNGWRTAFAINEQIIPDTLSFRVSGERYHSDGFVDNPTRGEDDYDSRNLWAGKAKLLWTPNSDFKAIASYNIQDSRGGEDFVEGSTFPDQRINFSDLEAKEGSKHQIVNLRAEYKLNPFFTLKSESSYYKLDYIRLEDGDQDTDPGLFVKRDNVTKSYTQETKIAFENDWIKGAVGVFYTQIDEDDDAGGSFEGSFIGIPIPGLIAGIDFQTVTETENLAFFGEADIKLPADFTLTLGGRYDREKFEQVNITSALTTNLPLPFPLPPGSTETLSGEFQSFLPKIGLAYNWTPDVKTGVVIQKGYRAGGAQRNPLNGNLSEFDPEFTWNYELYLRSQWWNRRLTTNFNVYYTDWKNQQVNVIGPSGNPNDVTTTNAGSSRSIGGELEIKANLTDQLDVFAALGYANNKFEDFPNESGGLVQNFAGNIFPFSPEFTVSAGASYRFLNGWEVHADVSYTGDQEGDASNRADLKIDDRFIANAKVGYVAETWSAFAFVRNMFDEEYIYQTTGEPNPRVRSGEPRVLGITASAKF